jgi:tetratricopeptide (TPR) repeat protein
MEKHIKPEIMNPSESHPSEPYYSNMETAYYNNKMYDEAISDYTKAIEINPEYVWAYNTLAWFLATCPDVRYRDGLKAIELA